jgi:hypothetical protein
MTAGAPTGGNALRTADYGFVMMTSLAPTLLSGTQSPLSVNWALFLLVCQPFVCALAESLEGNGLQELRLAGSGAALPPLSS